MSVFRFRDFQYDSVERRLKRKGEWVDLTPKAMDILEVFLARPGQLITRDEIIGKVWGSTLVEEGNLSVHISKLRKALAESRDQRYIETLAGSGYRFTALIEPASNGHSISPAPDPIHASNGDGFHGRNSEAVRLLTKGKHFFENINPTTIPKAIECLERSLTFDPSNPETSAYLVRAYRLLHSFGLVSVDEALRKIDGPMNQMVSSEKASSSALSAAGEVEMLLKANFGLAEKHFRNAIELDPDSASVLYRLCEVLVFSKRETEALEKIPLLVDLQAYSPSGYVQIARLFYFLRRYESSLVYLDEVLELEPHHFPARLVYGSVLAELRKYDEAESAFSESYDLHPNPESLAMLGYVYALQGKTRDVMEIAAQIATEYQAYPSINLDMARMLLASGDHSGYHFLQRAVSERESDLIGLNTDPRWDRVRHQERFKEIAQDYFPSENKQPFRSLERADVERCGIAAA